MQSFLIIAVCRIIYRKAFNGCLIINLLFLHLHHIYLNYYYVHTVHFD
jgi:hypothetical protein